MADDKEGRDDQADRADSRQRERAVTEALSRADEPRPPFEEDQIEEIEQELEPIEYPASGSEIVDTIGDHELETTDRSYAVADLVPETDEKTFEDPRSVRTQIERPTIAGAIKRILEAGAEQDTEYLRGSQRGAYEKTLLAMKTIDADDDDEPIEAITDWIVERIQEKGALPGSRAVRRQAAKICRANEYQVRNDEWLGV